MHFIFFATFIALIQICHGISIAPTIYPGNATLVASKRLAHRQMPVVLMHGMGDSAHGKGMISIAMAISMWLNQTYTTSMAMGTTKREDVRNSFLMNMDRQVERFAKNVKFDPKLKHGFNALGFSQGSLVIRGYIQRYNDPPVLNFISIHGPLGGISQLPKCSPGAILCRLALKIFRRGVYSSFSQKHSAQSNYYRNPLAMPKYRRRCRFLPDINNEGARPVKKSYGENFASLEKLIMIKANLDTMIMPRESQWFGAFQDGTHYLLTMDQTKWFQQNLFGLKTLHESGRLFFEMTSGNHLQFTQLDLKRWIANYFAIWA